jgi:hypothetical protein
MGYFAVTITAALMQVSPTTSAATRLGPISVTATAVDDRMHWIRYTVLSELPADVGVTFWSFEILRVYADGTQIVSIQETDFLETAVLGCAGVGSLLILDRGFGAGGHRSDHAQPAKDVGRLDVPVQVRVWPTAVMLSDGSVFGNRARIDQVVERRRRFLREFATWLSRFEQSQIRLPGLMGLRYFEDEISDPNVGSEDVTPIRQSFRYIVEGLDFTIQRGDPDTGQIARAIKNATDLLNIARHASQITLH